MASSPEFKVYSPQGEYVASCKFAEDAAAVVALHGTGAKIKHYHKQVLWHEGAEDQEAGESFDHVALACWARIDLARKERRR